MLVVIILVFYFIFLVFIYDFLILVIKVQKWCVNLFYVYFDITLFYVLVRDFGVILGLGIVFFIVRLVLRVGMNYWRVLRNV